MNWKNRTLFLAMGLACVALNSQAATQLKNQDAMGGINNILINDTQARMETPKEGQYMIMQFKDKKAYAINDKQKQIVDMDAPMPENKPNPAKPEGDAPKPAEVKAELVKKDAGPKIAGYDTVHYQVLANGEVCSDEYLSSEALKVAHIKDFIQGMQDFAQERRKQMGGMGAMMQQRPCFAAKEQLNEQFNQAGLSMRSVDKAGKTKHEIIEIKTDVKTDEQTFTLPKDYAVTTPFEMMQKALANLPKQGQGMVDGKPPADAQTQIESLIKQRMEQKAQEAAKTQP
jgi:hypothetical protein